jgi:hypothetical protein
LKGKCIEEFLGPVYDSEKKIGEKQPIKIFTQWLKKPHYNRYNKVKRIVLVWGCTENGRK